MSSGATGRWGARSSCGAWASWATLTVSNLLASEGKLAGEVRARRNVQDSAREGLVEGSVGVAVALDAAALAQGLLEGLAEGEATVLGGVVVVNVEVALTLDVELHAAVLGHGGQHLGKVSGWVSRVSWGEEWARSVREVGGWCW